MIDILLPSRGRPERLKDMLESVALTSDSDIHVIVAVDKDEMPLYEQQYAVPITLIYAQGNLSQMWNQCFIEGFGDIVMHASDDIIFETQGWDKSVIEHFRKCPESLMYCMDGHQDKNCPTHSFTSRSASEKIGYFLPPYFEADFNDVWLRDVYTKAGKIFYYPDIMIRHNHVNVDSKFDDETYRLAVERRKRAALVWEEKNHLIEKDIERLCV